MFSLFEIAVVILLISILVFLQSYATRSKNKEVLLLRINQQLTWMLYLDKKAEETMLFHSHHCRFPGDRTHHEVLRDQFKGLWAVEPGCAGDPEVNCWADFVALRMMQQGMSEAEVIAWKNNYHNSISPAPGRFTSGSST
jgi:hypothetical protein